MVALKCFAVWWVWRCRNAMATAALAHHLADSIIIEPFNLIHLWAGSHCEPAVKYSNDIGLCQNTAFRRYSALCKLGQFANEARHNTNCIKTIGYYPSVPRKYLVILCNGRLPFWKPFDYLAFTTVKPSVLPSDFLGGLISGADLGICDRTTANLFTRRRRITHRTEIELTH